MPGTRYMEWPIEWLLSFVSDEALVKELARRGIDLNDAYLALEQYPIKPGEWYHVGYELPYRYQRWLKKRKEWIERNRKWRKKYPYYYALYDDVAQKHHPGDPHDDDFWDDPAWDCVGIPEQW